MIFCIMHMLNCWFWVFILIRLSFYSGSDNLFCKREKINKRKIRKSNEKMLKWTERKQMWLVHFNQTNEIMQKCLVLDILFLWNWITDASIFWCNVAYTRFLCCLLIRHTNILNQISAISVRLNNVHNLINT